MSSRNSIAHIISNSAPNTSQIGDEYFSPTTGKLYKNVVSSGTSVGFLEIPILSSPVNITNTSVSYSTQTGALTVAGGVAIAGDLRIAGTVYGTVSGSITAATNLSGGTAGQVPYQTGAGATSFYGPGTAGQLLVSAGAAAPTYTNTSSIYVAAATNSVNLFGGTAGQLVYQSGANTSGFVGPGSWGQFLISTGANAPTYQSTLTTVGGNIIITSNTAASTTSSGALQVVNGGVGIGGGIVVGGVSTVTNNTAVATTNSGALQVVNGGVGIGGGIVVGGVSTVTNTTAVSSTSTGALQVRGGVGVWGGAFFSGIVTATNFIGTFTGTITTATNIAGGTAGQVPYQTGAGATSFYGPGTAGQLLVSAGASAPTYTNTSSIYVQDSNVSTNLRSGSAGQLVYQSGANTSGFVGSGSWGQFLISTGANAPTYQSTLTTVGGNIIITSNTAASTTSSGALQIVNGGLGVGGGAVFGGTVTATNFVGNITGTVTGQASSVANAVTFNNANTGDASGTTYNGSAARTISANTLGALSLTGGGTVSGAVTFSGPVTFSGTATYVLSTNTWYTDNILELHTPPGGVTAPWFADDGKDIGLRFHYYTNSTDTNAALVLDNTTKYLDWYSSGAESLTGDFSTATFGIFRTANIKLVGGTANSGNTSSGDLTVLGGVGVGGNMYVAGTITAGSFSGAVTGATTQVQTVQQTTSGTYYATFVDSNTAAATGKSVYTTSTFIINPANGNISLGTSVLNNPFTVSRSVAATTTTNYFVGLQLYNSSDGGTRILAANSVAANLAAIDLTVLSSGAGTDDGVIAFHTANNASLAERGRFDNSGRFFINTTTQSASSSELFEVYNGMTLLDFSSDSVATLYLRNRSTTAATVQPYIYFTDGGGNRGGIGIRTSDSTLHEYGSSGINWLTGGASFTAATQRAGIDSTGIFTIYTTTSVSSTSTGALQVRGGVGVWGGGFFSGVVTATTFVGAFTGAVTGAASQLNTQIATASATYYPTFVDSNNASATAELVYTTSTFILNPATGQVGINSTFLSTGSTLTVNGRIESVTDASGEGGQFVMRSQGFAYRWSLDNYYGAMRIIREDDVTAGSGVAVVTITSGTSNIFVVGGSSGYSGEKFAVNGGAYVNGILTATNIYGTFNGTFAGSAASVANSLTINNGGSGSASGATFNGSAAVTISYNTVGASAAGYLTDASNTRQYNGFTSLDSRSTNYAPGDRTAGLYADFKQNTTDGLADGGTYHGVLTFRSYGTSNTDFTGGIAQQIAYTDNNNLWHRGSTNSSTWGTWYKVIDTGNTGTAYVNRAVIADQLNTQIATASASYYPTFVDSNNASATAEIHYTTSSFTINPASGNVGIGTASPGAKLEVAMSRTASTNGIVLQLSDNVTGAQTDGVYKSIRSTSNGGSSISEIRFLETDGTNNNTSIAFATQSTAGALTERMRVTQTGALAFAGAANYGSSGQILQSNGNAAPTWVNASSLASGSSTNADNLKTIMQTASGTYYPAFVDSNNSAAAYEAYYTTSSFSINAATGLVTHSGPSGDGVPILRVNGTTAPAAGFNWAASFMNSSLTTSKNTVILIGQAESTKNSGYIGFNYAGTAGSNSSFLTFGMYANDNLVNIHANGNVNIGTTTDQGYKLGVSGTLRSTAVATLGTSVAQGDPSATDVTANATLLLSGVGGNYLSFGQKASNLCQWIQSAYQNPTTAVYPISLNPLGGNVGVGTLSPSYGLDVAVASGLRVYNGTYNGNLVLGSSAGWASGLRTYDNGDVELRVWHANSRGQIVIATGFNGDQATTLPSDGIFVVGDNTGVSPSLKVGIGYTAANIRGGFSKLAVNGNVSIGNTGTTTSTSKFEVYGTQGQLFSVNDSFTGTIFSANDISGVPSIEVIDSGLIKFAQYSGQVAISTGTVQTGMGLTVNTGTYITSLGIGTVASGTLGEIRATNEITAYYSSDQRLKENVSVISNPIEIVQQIRGVRFDWKDDYIAQRGGEDGYFVRKQDIGVIAQEVEAVLPEVVATRDDGIKAVKYEKLVALLIEAVKDQQQQIDRLTKHLGLD